MLAKVGETETGLAVVSGVFRFYETHGLPLDILLDALRMKGAIPCWISFYREALVAGMKHDRIIAKLREAISDVFGDGMATYVCDRLERLGESDV